MNSENDSDESEESSSESKGAVYHVMAEDRLDEGERVRISIEDQNIAIFKVNGEHYAIQNYCLHQGASMCDGEVLYPSYMESTETETSWDLSQNQEVPTVACPWHAWEYDLETGDHVAPTNYTLSTYETVVEDGELYVKI